eukprot:2856626-Amphidinium_carterae.1
MSLSLSRAPQGKPLPCHVGKSLRCVDVVGKIISSCMSWESRVHLSSHSFGSAYCAVVKLNLLV